MKTLLIHQYSQTEWDAGVIGQPGQCVESLLEIPAEDLINLDTGPESPYMILMAACSVIQDKIFQMQERGRAEDFISDCLVNGRNK